MKDGAPPPFLGHDGAITLVAALLLAVLTAGIAPLLATLAVLRTARGAPTMPAVTPERVLVLGHRLEGGAPSPAFVARLSRAAMLARAAPRARLMVLGGRTSPGAPAEAEAGRGWLLAQGVARERIALETGSRHTLENLSNHRAAHGTGSAEALVTSRLHLHRALTMARGMGLSPSPVAAEDAFRLEIRRLLAEGFMVHWYVTGRMLARLLRRGAWLARIG